jgi:hypothetical protein
VQEGWYQKHYAAPAGKGHGKGKGKGHDQQG